MKNWRISKDGWRGLLDFLAGKPEPFHGNSMYGHPGRHAFQGWMPNDEWNVYQALPVDYTVISYHTVIAYKVTGGNWVVPDVNYSKTTARHQGVMHTVVQFLNK